MKIIIKQMLFAFLFITFITSCNDEELFIEPTSEDIVDLDNPDETEDEEEKPEDTEDELVNPSFPCDFNLTEIQAGDTVIINCAMNLAEQTITLPENVSIIYEGGSITNGVLNFADNSIISGELLNNTLDISGLIPKLKDPVFSFMPERWGIEEGKVSDAFALKNKEIIQNTINTIIDYGVTKVYIDEMDCYLGVGGNWSLGEKILEDGISLPSNFTLEMTSNTFLRVQPNKWPRYNVLNASQKDNVTIIGGNIIGDRYTHDYSPINDEFGISRNEHGWGTLVVIAGCSNSTVDNVIMRDSTGDGFVFASGTNRLYNPPIFCTNITVKNCTIDNSRRNNITIGDGEFLYIDNCTITNAGGGDNILNEDGTIKTYTSAGVAPQFGIDMEAHRELENGVYVDYQIVENVFVTRNSFTGNYAGDIVVFTANDVTIDDNDFDNVIAGSLFWNSTIKNNRLTQRAGGVKTSIGILFNPISDVTRVSNNKIINNTITGFDTGISAFGKDLDITDNKVNDFKEAVYLRRIIGSEIKNNTYHSDRSISHGYLSFGGSTSNVTISGDKIDVNHRPVYLFNFNEDSAESSLTIENCEFTSPKELYLENSNNVTIKKKVGTEKLKIEEVNCTNIVIEND